MQVQVSHAVKQPSTEVEKVVQEFVEVPPRSEMGSQASRLPRLAAQGRWLAAHSLHALLDVVRRPQDHQVGRLVDHCAFVSFSFSRMKFVSPVKTVVGQSYHVACTSMCQMPCGASEVHEGRRTCWRHSIGMALKVTIYGLVSTWHNTTSPPPRPRVPCQLGQVVHCVDALEGLDLVVPVVHYVVVDREQVEILWEVLVP